MQSLRLSRFTKIWLAAVLACAGLVYTGCAAAVFCTPLNAPPPRFVGDTASDGQCTDDTIQSAIDYVKNAGYACPATIYITREHKYNLQHLTIDNVSTPLNLVGEGDGVQCGSTNVQLCDPSLGCPPPPTAPLVTITGDISHASFDSVLHIDGISSVMLRYLTLTGAEVHDKGAGIYLSGSGSLTLDTSVVTANTAENNGGGIYFNSSGLLTLDSSEVSSNTAINTGGGIDFEGTGSMTISNSSIHNNSADYGGGIDFKGTGDPATDLPAVLQLNQNTLILNNTASTSGGGIRIEGDAQLLTVEPQTFIAFNHAPGGYGGGIEMLGGDATAVIGSPGYNGAPLIEYNSAEYGGGLAMLAQQQSWNGQYTYLFTTDPSAPTGIADNAASHVGGGVYLKPYVGNTDVGFVTFCAADFRITDNIAQEGSAIYADTDRNAIKGNEGSTVDLNPIENSTDCANSLIDPFEYGAQSCAGRADCNVINDNAAEDTGGNPTNGAAILVQSQGVLRGHRVSVSGNRGGAAVRQLTDGGGEVYLVNCLLADNTLSGPLIDAYTPGTLDIYSSLELDNCTLVGSTLGSGPVIHDQVGVTTLTDSIIDQPGHVTLALDGFADSVSYLLSNDTSTLPTQSGVVQGEPTFVDAAMSDYHLHASSLGVDFAPAAGGIDLDGLPRDTDLSSVPNVYGPRDLGAYERLNPSDKCGANDSFFCDGFDR